METVEKIACFNEMSVVMKAQIGCSRQRWNLKFVKWEKQKDELLEQKDGIFSSHCLVIYFTWLHLDVLKK